MEGIKGDWGLGSVRVWSLGLGPQPQPHTALITDYHSLPVCHLPFHLAMDGQTWKREQKSSRPWSSPCVSMLHYWVGNGPKDTKCVAVNRDSMIL